MYEKKHQPLLSRRKFIIRQTRSAVTTLSIVGGALAIGTLGYHFFADLPWIDAELNAAMILTGMGPIDPMKTPGAKIFASAYAIFSGVAFLSSVGLLFAPLFHRIMHRFHLQS